jgi:hypothetical protein
VVDFALLPKHTVPRKHPFEPRARCDSHLLSSARAIVIELNPFNKRTGASLFKWESETQLDISGAFEFRLIGDEFSASFSAEHKSMLFDIMLQEAGSAFVQRGLSASVSVDLCSSSNRCSLS